MSQSVLNSGLKQKKKLRSLMWTSPFKHLLLSTHVNIYIEGSILK